ncbi:hypothetical protein [Kitasatospora paranensis]|uniref:Septum formation-related domain-containing protein n=1 Tax=Kitasatospora paranensis TaxID=258053 RepID=A0ABW2G3H9_9ACTN
MAQARGRRIAAVVVVVAVAAVVAAVLLWPERHPRAASAPPPSSAPPSPSASPTKQLPYPFFTPGTCLDHPQLSKVITRAEERPCSGPHDGEAIADVVLPEGLTSDLQIGRALRDLCKDPLAARTAAQGGGGPYYGFPLGPYLQYYKQGMRDATCTMTVSNRQDGRKLTGSLR